MNKQPKEAAHLRVNPAWLARRIEPVLEPAQPIIDCHHHLWDRAGWRYLVDDLQSDVGSGHAVCSTVFVECRTHYRTGGQVIS